MMEKCIVISIVRTAIVPHIVRQSILHLISRHPVYPPHLFYSLIPINIPIIRLDILLAIGRKFYALLEPDLLNSVEIPLF